MLKFAMSNQKTDKNMKRDEILSAIKSLALSQGFYGRLYNLLVSNTENGNAVLSLMEEQNFADVVDMVMWIETA